MGQYDVPRGKNSVGQNEAGFSWGKCLGVKLLLTVWCTERLEGKPQQDCMMYPISRGTIHWYSVPNSSWLREVKILS